MLGSMVYNILKKKHQLVLIYRSKKKLDKLDKIYKDVSKHEKVLFDFNDLKKDYLDGFPKKTISPNITKLIDKLGEADAFVNCLGITNRYAEIDPLSTYIINSALPYILSSIYKHKLIHITTDCVFNGIKGAPYNESSPPTPTDLYGLTKSLGEPYQHSLILRTSVIGPEIDNFVSLLEWFKRQRGTVNGYVNHFWNGITSKQFAIICDQIISNRNQFPKKGLFHLYSTSVTKYDILISLKKKYQLDTIIHPYKIFPIDRRLTSRYNLCRELCIPSFSKMLQEL